MALTARFTHQAYFPCPAAELFAWHNREGALERLLPPWQRASVLARQGGIAPGGHVLMRIQAGPLSYHWQARHTDLQPPTMFRDIQERGPFATFAHTHHFSDTPRGALLEDCIDYALPGQRYLPKILTRQVDQTLGRMFAYRETVLRNDILLHQRCSRRPLRILISGASGVLGRALVPLLTTGGHQVHTLVRRPPITGRREIFWDPAKGILDREALPEVDGVIHLAGEYIGLKRWDAAIRERVLASRVAGTRLLTEAIAAQSTPPAVFLGASAIGYYGDCGQDEVTEDRPAGTDFISTVCTAWEEAAAPARQAGIRTVLMRLGVGLSQSGGALHRLLALRPLGIFRRFGTGNQLISWISIDDMIAAMLHCLVDTNLTGPLNIAAPQPATNEELMASLATIGRLPLLPAIPATLLHLVYGQMAGEIALSSCRVSVAKLAASGFTFRHPSLAETLCHQLGTGHGQAFIAGRN